MRSDPLRQPPAGQETDFRVDFPVGRFTDPSQCEQEELLAAVNWRESLVCPETNLNNRQRAVALFALDHLAQRGASKDLRVYLQEQITPFFRWFEQVAGDAEIIGSEWLGPDIRSGEVRNDIRHEDVRKLSFADQSIDMVISQDVMEHVPDPAGGFGEIARVLKPGGLLLMTIPLATENRTQLRAHLGTRVAATTR